MAGSSRQASLSRRGVIASVLMVLQIALLSAGLVIPISVVSASTGTQVPSEDYEEGISLCGHKRCRSRSFVVTRPAVAVARDTAVLRIRSESSERCAVRALDGHRYANGLLAPLRC